MTKIIFFIKNDAVILHFVRLSSIVIMMSEKEICQGCKQGIASAQRELFDQYSPLLMAVIYRYVGNDDDASDVLQDTFVKILTTIQHFKWKDVGSLQAWTTKVAVNTAINFLRQQKRLKATSQPVETIGEPPDQEEDDEFTRAVNNLDVSTLMQMIAELPDGYRAVFNLYCLDGFSHKEIAEQLGINEKTSSSQLSRAKSLLAKRIKAYINEQQFITTTQ